MLKIYDRYLMRQLLLATFVIAGGLAMIVLMTQSLKLIELVLETSASAKAFATLMGLSVPRFIEAVLPASTLIATLFVFHRMGMDSEMVVLKSSGASPLRLARPVFLTSGVLLAVLLTLSLWIAPEGVSHMMKLRKEIHAQFAHLLFREGIFNTVGADLTAYVRARSPDGRLLGLMVHDTREVSKGGPAVTIVARSGHVLTEDEGQKIIVYDGSRQEKDQKTGRFSRLDFKQYTLDIPASSGVIDKRWSEPDERTLSQLTDSKELAQENPVELQQFRAELHRRLSTALLLLSFALIGVASLLLGPFSRSGQMPLLGLAAFLSMTLQGAYLYLFNLAKSSPLACLGMYIVAAAPIAVILLLLSPTGERLLSRLTRIAGRYIHLKAHDRRRP